MNNQIDYSELIDRYLNNKMEQDELKWFTREMDNYPSLAEEVRLQKEIGEAILNEETLEFRAQISSLFEKETAAPTRIRTRKHLIPGAARIAVASLAALIMLGTGIWFYTHRTIEPDTLFEMYYEPYDGLMNVRSGNSQVADLLVSAMQKYETGEFESALLLFETVLANDRNNITSRFYSGISYMETDRFSVAESSFTGVIDHKDNLFIEHAEWYLGLCYLKTGKIDEAEELLTAIAETDGYYSRQARRISRNL